jgi:hypothetical protein
MGLACVEMMVSFPAAIYFVAVTYSQLEIKPYISWAHVHEDWDTTYSIPSEDITPSLRSTFEFGRWLGIIAAWIFFVFFGLTGDVSRSNIVHDALPG